MRPLSSLGTDAPLIAIGGVPVVALAACRSVSVLTMSSITCRILARLLVPKWSCSATVLGICTTGMKLNPRSSSKNFQLATSKDKSTSPLRISESRHSPSDMRQVSGDGANSQGRTRFASALAGSIP